MSWFGQGVFAAGRSKRSGADGRAVVADAYRFYWDGLCRYIQRTFGSGPPEPEDVAQAAFTQFAALEDPAAIANPKAFLYRSARNFVVDQHRRQRVRARYAQNELNEAETPADFDAARVLESRERLALIEAVIRQMPERQRMVLVMNRIDGLSYAEVARRSGMSETNVKRLVVKAVIECQRALRAADGSNDSEGEAGA